MAHIQTWGSMGPGTAATWRRTSWGTPADCIERAERYRSTGAINQVIGDDMVTVLLPANTSTAKDAE